MVLKAQERNGSCRIGPDEEDNGYVERPIESQSGYILTDANEKSRSISNDGALVMGGWNNTMLSL